MPRWVRALVPLLLLVTLILPALQPLWQPGLQQTHDGMHHLSRLFGLDQTIRAGHLGTRWLADEGFGYGFPVLNFYAPLTYYVGMLWRWSGLGLVTGLEWTIATGLVLSLLTMYLFARRLLGQWSGALAAMAYVWAPYHLADAWMRGALAELWAFVWFPLLLLAEWEVAGQRGRAMLIPILWGGAVFGGLILTHNLSVLLALPVLSSWGVFILLLEKQGATERWRALGGLVLLAALGVLLSAAFWLPALAEARFIWASRAPLDFDVWRQQLVAPGYLLSRWWVQRYEVLQAIGTLHPLGQAQLLLALLGVGVGVWRWRSLARCARWGLPLFAGLALFGFFMQTAAAAGIWHATPGLLLLQFPWRWQAVTTLALGLISGYGMYAVTPLGQTRLPQFRRVPALILLAAVLISSALPGLTWLRASYPTAEEAMTDVNMGHQAIAMYDYSRGLWLREYGGALMFEYMPIWVQVPRTEFFLPATASQTSAEEPALAVQLRAGRQTPLERHFTAVSAAPWTLQLHQFYFPGWEAIVAGRRVLAEPIGPLGLAGVHVPALQQEIVFRFGTTWPRQLGWALTLVGVGVWLAAAVWLRRWRWLAVVAVTLLLFGGLGVMQRQLRPTDYTPTNLTVNFGDQAQLVGYTLDAGTLRPGVEPQVTLNWLALRQPTRNFKVFLHLVDPTGKLWAQHDGQPGDWFSPTSRWQAGEFIEDRHVLAWHASPPAGRYLLFVGMYDAATGERLPTFEADGTPIGDQVLLGEVEITS